MNDFTEAQLPAITSTARRVCVMAGPGSGKTRVLVERVARAVAEQRLDLARTLAITFTENAAAEMKERLAAAFEKRGLEQQRRLLETAYISTIHGFCARLLREQAIEAGVDPRFAVLDEVYSGILKQATADQLLERRRVEQPDECLEFTRHFSPDYRGALLKAYDRVREQGGDPERTAELLKELPADPGSPDAERERQAAAHRRAVAGFLRELHAAYTRRKQALGALDFTDLEKLTVRMLQGHPDLAARIGRRFDEILVDEYQDTSGVQDCIVELLSANSRLFLVGDAAQSIYGFRNADPQAFRRRALEAEEAGDCIPLREDFRSRPEIIRAVNLHFAERLRKTGVPFELLESDPAFAGKSQPSVELILIADQSGKASGGRPQEARRLARRIAELAAEPKSGEPKSGGRRLAITNPKREADFGRILGYGDFAMLFRSASDIKLYERALEDEGIPYFSETGRGFYQAREVRDVISFLRVLDNSRNEQAVAVALRSPMFGLSDDALYLLAEYAHREAGRRLPDILPSAENIPGLPPEDLERVRSFRELLTRLREQRGWLSIAQTVRDIVRGTGYDATLLLEPGGRRKVANLHKLAEVAATLERAGFESLNDFVRAVDRFHFEEAREGEAQLDSAAEGAVRLMTMHAAKGLEFPVVIIPDLSRHPPPDSDDAGFLPEFGLGVKFTYAEKPETTPVLETIRAQVKEQEEAERLRVLFVAMSRAQEHLILSGCMKHLKKGWSADKALKEICESYSVALPCQLSGEWRVQTAGEGPGGFQFRLLATGEALPESAPFDKAPVAVRKRLELEAGASLNMPIDSAAEEQARKIVAEALRPIPEGDGADFIAAATDVMEFRNCPRRYYLARYLGYDTQARTFARLGEELESEEEKPADEFPRSELGQAVHRLLADGAGALDAYPARLRDKSESLAGRFWQSALGRRILSLAPDNIRKELPVTAAIRKQSPGKDDHFLHGILDVLTFEDGRPELLLDYKSNEIAAGEVAERAEQYRVQMLLYALLVEAAFGTPPREAVLYFLEPGVAHRIEINPAALQEARALLDSFFQAQRDRSFPAVVSPDCHRCAFSGHECRAPQRQYLATSAS